MQIRDLGGEGHHKTATLGKLIPNPQFRLLSHHLPAAQATELGDRQVAWEDQVAALRESLSQLQQATEEGVEMGKLQWAMLQARRNEGESQRREAAAVARLHHVQAQLYRLQLTSEERDGALNEAVEARRTAENEQVERPRHIPIAARAPAPYGCS